MTRVLYTQAEVSSMIQQGQPLLLAGDEKQLRQLPRGSWIGGTIPYFMGEQGGEFSQEKIFVTPLPKEASLQVIRSYEESTISQVYAEAPENGFSVIILPAGSKIHQAFSLQAPTYPQFATRPLVGWVAGVFLGDLGKTTPKVFNGRNGQVHENQAVVLQAVLPKDKAAVVEIANMFAPGEGDTLVFETEGFSAREVLVNGKKQNLVQYLLDRKIDTKLPLVADYFGAMVNISFQAVHEAEGRVDFYAPVFKGMEYKLAKPVADYIQSFEKVMRGSEGKAMVFACNCILNYLYSGLEHKKTGNVTGPITFGEIAYQLLNQTMVYMTLEDIR